MLVIGFIGLRATTAQPQTDGAKRIQGVCLVAPPSEFEGNPFDAVKKLGATHVAVIPYAFCQPDKPTVRYQYDGQWWGETIAGAKQTIAYAREKGLEVMVKPHLWVGGQGWAGELSFDNNNEWQTWQASYRAYILRFARLAEEHEVGLLTIGTECKQLVRRHPDFWRSLIQDVRKVYKGELTYQANWDNVQHVAFWDQLDYISISGYFPLVKEPDPDPAKVKKAWKSHIQQLKQVHLAYGKPVIFGEYGYCSKRGTLAKPWKGHRSAPAAVDLKVQRTGYESLYETIWKASWFHGGFIWKWYADDEEAGGPENPAYTPQNKPAQQLIRKVYQNP